MTRERRSTGEAGPGGEAPRLLLPGDLPRSLRHLDDGQLEELLRAAGAEARRRGLKAAGADIRQPGGRKPAGGATAKRGEPAPLRPGLERVVRAALEAGVKPAAIAREFGISRAQVQRVAAAAKRGG